MVVNSKGINQGECLRCYYILRGSFRKIDAGMMRKLLRQHASLKDKFLGLEAVVTFLRFRSLRRRHIKATSRNPKAKPRHEAVDVRHFTEKKDSSYCDIYQDHISSTRAE